jgi:hypothetical protein
VTRAVAKKKGLPQSQGGGPSAPEQLECDADPRIDYRSRLINLLSEAERIAPDQVGVIRRIGEGKHTSGHRIAPTHGGALQLNFSARSCH